MTGELKQTILTMLNEHNTLTLATSNQARQPEAAAVFYVNHGLQLFFFSNPNSRHAQNIGNGSSCAVTVQKDYASWQEIKGLQLEGMVFPLTNAMEKALAMKLYLAKFRFLSEVMVEGHKIFQAFQKSKIYKITPAVIWLTDNKYAFGNRRKLVINWSSGNPICEIE